MLGSLMATPDADPDFLTMLQHAIVARLRQGAADAAGAGKQMAPGGGAGMSGMGGPAGVMGPGAGGGGMDMSGGMSAPPGMDMSQQAGPPQAGPPGLPNPDELRRMLGAGGMTQ